MRTRKVTVIIYQYPQDANRTMSLRRFMDMTEELLWSERFVSDRDLRDILEVYRQKIIDFAALIGVPHVYRVVVRDSDSRLIGSYRF